MPRQLFNGAPRGALLFSHQETKELSLQLTYSRLRPQLEQSRLAAILAGLAATERNWFYGLLIVIGSGILFWTVQVFEQSVVHIQPDHQLVENASEVSMRFLGQSHFIVALLFLLSSRRMRTTISRAYFAALIGFGLVLCWAFSSLGAMKSPLAVILFYSYFMVHDFRDQIFFYQANGDAPQTRDPKTLAKDLVLIPVLLFAVFAATFLVAVIFQIGDGRHLLVSLRQAPPVFYWSIIALPIAITIAMTLIIKRRYDRRYAGGVREFIRRHRPMFVVFPGTYAVLMGGLIVSGRAYAIVNLHVCTWYVFSLYHLGKQTVRRTEGLPLTWVWMRTTTTGFNFLHIGIAALLIFAGAVWAYGFRNNSQSTLWFVVSRDVMPYWTILHVTTSFLPRK